MTLTKAELIQSLITNQKLSKSDAKLFVDRFFEVIIKTLAKNELVKLSSFGNFITRDKRARPGRNPRTGQEVTVTARRVVTFHAGNKLKAQVESGKLQVSEQDFEEEHE